MKLYEVDLLCNHCEDVSGMTVANSEEEAIAQFIEERGIDFSYCESASEIKELCGYKIVFKKGKKIALIKS